VGARDFSLFAKCPNWLWDPIQPPTAWMWEFFPIGRLGMRVKQLKHEVNCLPPSSAEIKNEWSYTSALPVCLHSMDRYNFTTTLYALLNLSITKFILSIH
jgi:hypothetical protein